MACIARTRAKDTDLLFCSWVLQLQFFIASARSCKAGDRRARGGAGLSPSTLRQAQDLKTSSGSETSSVPFSGDLIRFLLVAEGFGRTLFVALKLAIEVG